MRRDPECTDAWRVEREVERTPSTMPWKGDVTVARLDLLVRAVCGRRPALAAPRPSADAVAGTTPPGTRSRTLW